MPSQKKVKPSIGGPRKKGTSITGKSAVQIARSTSSGIGKALKGSKPTTLPSKHTRRIIRSHHTLLKRQAFLKKELENEIKIEIQTQIAQKNAKDATQDDALNTQKDVTNPKIEVLKSELKSIEQQIIENGGIEQYQRASIAGQDNTRGGDTSKLLVEWLQELGITSAERSSTENTLSLLEVGSLSSQNACSTKGIFNAIERIDLNSQDPKHIKQQDFMKRPLPGVGNHTKMQNGKKNSTIEQIPETFDVISLSLVVNYVSDPQTRGEMLLRTTEFLNKKTLEHISNSGHKASKSQHIKFSEDNSREKESSKTETRTNDPNTFPCLFFVLPAPCIMNSRYLTEDHLTEIMHYIGYTKLLKKKVTSKLVYWLWKYGDKPEPNQVKSNPKDDSDTSNSSASAPNIYTPSPYIKQYINNMRVKSANDLEKQSHNKHNQADDESNNTSFSGITTGGQKKKAFAKKEVNPGGGRNNFAITL